MSLRIGADKVESGWGTRRSLLPALLCCQPWLRPSQGRRAGSLGEGAHPDLGIVCDSIRLIAANSVQVAAGLTGLPIRVVACPPGLTCLGIELGLGLGLSAP